MLRRRILQIVLYAFLLWQLAVVIYPLFIMVATSFKTNFEVLSNPFGWPQKLNLEGYRTVWELNNFALYYRNSILVTVVSLGLILALSILAAYGLARFQFPGNRALYFYFLAGMMIPIRLGVLNLFRLFLKLDLFDNLLALILTYTAMGIPFSVFILTGFFAELPRELGEAAEIDGCNSWRALLHVYLPLMRPALATAAIYHFIPIWNDFYFPLVFIKSDHLKTIPLGTAIFYGQFQTDWPTVFAALTTAIIPALAFYLLMAGQFIKGLTAGAVKG
ncbi:carbohydrate ABC transporter permease [Moorella sulfitireducens]|uniref:carbohydrate ABC transporter permease n=1 Tax=Neomoorella sulfitireducens TaxID=2972948 RepID=UPI0021AD1C0D|nr:carbohydrate ABC transporter permease [Moorella sulfitireducens]